MGRLRQIKRWFRVGPGENDGVGGEGQTRERRKNYMINKGDGGDREMANKIEQVLASEDIINYTRTPDIWLTCEEAGVWETGETI